jgi:hypothetical protein
MIKQFIDVPQRIFDQVDWYDLARVGCSTTLSEFDCSCCSGLLSST